MSKVGLRAFLKVVVSPSKAQAEADVCPLFVLFSSRSVGPSADVTMLSKGFHAQPRRLPTVECQEHREGASCTLPELNLLGGPRTVYSGGTPCT